MLNNTILKHQPKILLLGVVTNDMNTYDDHVLTGTSDRPKLILTLQRKLNLLKKIRYWTTNMQLRTISNSIFNGPLLYGVQLWGSSKPATIERVEKLRETVCRLTLGFNNTARWGRTQLFKAMGWLSINDTVIFLKNKAIHRTMSIKLPLTDYLSYTEGRDNNAIRRKEISSRLRHTYNLIPFIFKDMTMDRFKIHYKKFFSNPNYTPGLNSS